MYEKYGKFVCFGFNVFSVNLNIVFKEIYGFCVNVRKVEFYDVFVYFVFNIYNVCDRDFYVCKCCVLLYVFFDGVIKEVECYILVNICIFCEVIGDYGCVIQDNKGWSVLKNMFDWCNWLVMDIFGDLCFGKVFYMLDRLDNRYVVDFVGVVVQRYFLCGIMFIVNKFFFDKIFFYKIVVGCVKYMVYLCQ